MNLDFNNDELWLLLGILTAQQDVYKNTDKLAYNVATDMIKKIEEALK